MRRHAFEPATSLSHFHPVSCLLSCSRMDQRARLEQRFLPIRQRSTVQPPPGDFDERDDGRERPPPRPVPRPSSGRERGPPPYDYSLTRCMRVEGQILEHRRLNAPVGSSRRDCQPHPADIDYLCDRANRLHHTIILETSEELARIAGKFGAVPGVIFITELGRVVSRGDQEIVRDNFDARPGPGLELSKLRRVFSLCNMADVDRDQIEAIIPEEFLPYDISDSPCRDEVADVRSF